MKRPVSWNAWLWLCLLVIVWIKVGDCRRYHNFVEWEELEKAENEDSSIKLKQLFKRYAYATHRKKTHKPNAIFGDDNIHVRHRKILDYHKIDASEQITADQGGSGTESGDSETLFFTKPTVMLRKKNVAQSGDHELYHDKTSTEGRGNHRHDAITEVSREIPLERGQQSGYSDRNEITRDSKLTATIVNLIEYNFSGRASEKDKETTRNKISPLVSHTKPTANTSPPSRSTTHYTLKGSRHSVTHDISSLAEESTIGTKDSFLINDRSARHNEDRVKSILVSSSTLTAVDGRHAVRSTGRGMQGESDTNKGALSYQRDDLFKSDSVPKGGHTTRPSNGAKHGHSATLAMQAKVQVVTSASSMDSAFQNTAKATVTRRKKTERMSSTVERYDGTFTKYNSIESKTAQTTETQEQVSPDGTTEQHTQRDSEWGMSNAVTYSNLSSSSARNTLNLNYEITEHNTPPVVLSSKPDESIPDTMSVTQLPPHAFSTLDHQSVETFRIDQIEGIPETVPTVSDNLSQTTLHFTSTSEAYHLFDTTKHSTRLKRTPADKHDPRTNVPSSTMDKEPDTGTTTEPTEKALVGWNQTCSGQGSCEKGLTCKSKQMTGPVCLCRNDENYSITLASCKSDTHWKISKWEISQNMESKTMSVKWIFQSPDARKDVEKYVIRYKKTKTANSRVAEGESRNNNYTFNGLRLGSEYSGTVELVLKSGNSITSQKKAFVLYFVIPKIVITSINFKTTTERCYDAKIPTMEVASSLDNDLVQVNFSLTDGCHNKTVIYIRDSHDKTYTTDVTLDSGCFLNQSKVRKEIVTRELSNKLKAGSSYWVVIEQESWCFNKVTPYAYDAQLYTYPGKPEASVAKEGTTYITISWKRHSEGSVDKYRIQVLNSANYSELLQEHNVPSSVLQHNVTGLEMGKSYMLTLSAEYKGIVGRKKGMLCTTLKYAPNAPSDLQWTTKNKLLTWTHADKDYGKTDFFRVRYDCSKTGSRSLDIQENEMNLFLHDGECCNISVTGVNAIGEGKPAEFTKNPSIDSNQQPIQAEGYRIDGDKAEVTWTRREITEVGSIYRFELKILESEGHTASHIWECLGEDCIMPCDYQAKLSGKTFLPDQNTFQLSFPIRPARLYSVRIKPIMIVNTLETTINFTVPDAPPTSPPINVSVLNIKEREVSLSWLPPIESNGRITNYNISIQYSTQNCSATLSIERSYLLVVDYRPLKVDLKGNYTIDRLLPFTNHSLSVAAINSAGQSLNWSTPVSFRTSHEPGNGQFRNVTKTYGSRFVKISWELPCPLYETITSYIIDVYKGGQIDVDQDFITTNTTVVIKDLQPITQYKIRIKGDNTNILSEFTFNTSIDVPGPVHKLELAQEERQDRKRRLFIKWNAPLIPNGAITGYNVTVESHCSQSGLSTLSTTNTSLNLPADPECCYFVKIFANTNAGSGPSEERDIFIKAGVPPPPRETSMQPLVHLGNRCSKEDASQSVPLHLPQAFLCDSSLGRITYRGLLVIKGDGRDKDSATLKLKVKLVDLPEVVPQNIQQRPHELLGQPQQISGRHPCRSERQRQAGESVKHQLPRSTGREFNRQQSHIILLPGSAATCARGTSDSHGQCDKEIPNDVYRFVVGKQSECDTRGCNPFLESGTRYRFIVFICTSAGCSQSLQSRIIQTEAIKSDASSLVYGILIATLLVIVLLMIFIAYKNWTRIRSVCSTGLDKETEVVELKTSEVPSRPQSTTPNNPSQIVDVGPEAPTKPIALEDFVQRVNIMHCDSNMMFSDEYKLVVTLSHKYESYVAELPAYRIKNRYTNILPFDHARVKLLPLDDDEPSDYINASFIPGARGPREYIAAQGPLPCTLDDFWRMIWEKRVNAVVMLTQCMEKGKVKCEPYWPNETGSVRLFGDLRVSLKSESNLPDYDIRVLDLWIRGKSRTIHQFHFLKWPDFGCPENTHLLLNLVAAVRDHTPIVPSGPMLVHCSAGVGRSGTYIALDMLLQQIQERDRTEVDIFSLVMGMRKNRPFMVQQENQYIFIHDCIRDVLMDKSEEGDNSFTSEKQIYQNT